MVAPKDHKDVKDNGDPKVRPMCNCKRSINGELSELLSTFLDPAARVLPNKEVISTEEAANQLNKFNEKIKRGRFRSTEA